MDITVSRRREHISLAEGNVLECDGVTFKNLRRGQDVYHGSLEPRRI